MQNSSLRQPLGRVMPFVIFILCFGYMGAYQPLGHPTGADWAQYMMGAQHIWWPSPDTTYPDWRAPLYLYLLGLLAHAGTYLQAGSWLASTGWFLMGGTLYGMALMCRRPSLGLECLLPCSVCRSLQMVFITLGPIP